MTPGSMGPNFLYIGTSKAGSTWLFNTLALHPEVHLADSKGLYYFDEHFTNGEQWYLRHFVAGHDKRAVGEVSHSYLSSREAAARIAELNPQMRLLVCLREPVDRAFSDYLDLVKNDQFAGTFEAALSSFPRLVERGRYAAHLSGYYESFPREQIHVGLFDDLQADAQAYADGVFEFLGIERLVLTEAARKSRMPAGTARNARVASAAKASSRALKRVGLARLRSRVKRSVVIRNALYRPFKDDRPVVDPGTAAELRRLFREDVQRLDSMLGAPVSERWGYPRAT